MKLENDVIQGWKRKCPNFDCGNETSYSNKHTYHRAELEKRCCRSCTQKINVSKRPPFSNETKKKMSVFRTGKTYAEMGIVCDLAARGKTISERKRGKKHSAEHNYALRLAKINWLKNNNFIFPTFNKTACVYFDQLNLEKGWNLTHALNGGEFFIRGYWLDAYDKDRNIVVEYDEPFHNKPSRKEKDEIRMKEVITTLLCRFFRYNVQNKELKEYKL